VEVIDIDQLHGNLKNPRQISKHDFDSLVASIREFGDLSGIVFNRASGQLVGGHQRINAFRQLGGQPVIEERFDQPNSVGTTARGHVLLGDEKYTYREVDWPLDTEDENGVRFSGKELSANVAANRIQGEFELDLLAEVNYMLTLSEDAANLQRLTGQTEDEISKLLDRVGVSETKEDADVPELDVATPPVSQPGQVFQLGGHRLMCGDSTDQGHVGTLMAGKRAAMVFTDPPYNVAYTGGGGKKREGILNDKMSGDAFEDFLTEVCNRLLEVTDGAIYICMSPKEYGRLQRVFQECGGYWASSVVWAKNTFTLSGSDYQHQYEPILYGWPQGVTNHYYSGRRDLADVWSDVAAYKANFDGQYTTIKIGGITFKLDGEVTGQIQYNKSETDIWKYDKPTKSVEHPTMKPVELCAKAILNSSLRDQIVLDLFGGSGSTLIAAEMNGRTCHMMELDPRYCDVIRKRYAKQIDAENEWQDVTPVIQQVAPTAASAPVQPQSETEVDAPAEAATPAEDVVVPATDIAA
jgi:DNA modification methylase